MRAKRAPVARAKRRLRLLVSTVPTHVLQNLTHGEAEHITNTSNVFFVHIWYNLYRIETVHLVQQTSRTDTLRNTIALLHTTQYNQCVL